MTRLDIISIIIPACYDHHDNQTQLLAQLRTAPVQDEAAVKKEIMET